MCVCVLVLCRLNKTHTEQQEDTRIIRSHMMMSGFIDKSLLNIKGRNTDSIVLPQVLQATVLQTLGTVQIGDVMVMIVEVSIGGKLWFSKKTMSYRILHIVTY